MQSFGAGGGPGPRSQGASAYMIIERPDSPSGGELQYSDETVLAAYVARREGRR
jgi:hypothetical protein